MEEKTGKFFRLSRETSASEGRLPSSNAPASRRTTPET